jgi:hypothetical protein
MRALGVVAVLVLLACACGGSDDQRLPEAGSQSDSNTTTASVKPLLSTEGNFTEDELPTLVLQQDQLPDGFRRSNEAPPSDATSTPAKYRVEYAVLANSSELAGTTCIDSEVKLYETVDAAKEALTELRAFFAGIEPNPGVPDAHSREFDVPAIGDESFGAVVSGTTALSCTGSRAKFIQQYFVVFRHGALLSTVDLITLDEAAEPEEVVSYARAQASNIESAVSLR